MKSTYKVRVKIDEGRRIKVYEGKIKKIGNSWRIEGKGGKLWDAHYDTKEDAEAGLRGYFANKNESKKPKITSAYPEGWDRKRIKSFETMANSNVKGHNADLKKIKGKNAKEMPDKQSKIIGESYGETGNLSEFEPWTEKAKYTWDLIKDQGKLDEFADYLDYAFGEEAYGDGIDDVALNDLLEDENGELHHNLGLHDDLEVEDDWEVENDRLGESIQHIKKNFKLLKEYMEYDEDIQLGDAELDTEMDSDDVGLPETARFINNIRKASLDAMSQLSDQSTSPEFYALKSIFDQCNKYDNQKHKNVTESRKRLNELDYQQGRSPQVQSGNYKIGDKVVIYEIPSTITSVDNGLVTTEADRNGETSNWSTEEFNKALQSGDAQLTNVVESRISKKK
jgi:hypothetical protein